MAENSFGQPVGEKLNWRGAVWPVATPMVGGFVKLRALHPDDAPALFDAYQIDREGRNWTYLPDGPFDDPDEFASDIAQKCAAHDPQFYVVLDEKDQQMLGVASYLRIAPAAGSIEVGWIHFSPLMQGKAGATEAMYLMMRRAFECGFRRYEWKCDALNEPSRKAAKRLGFTFEGVFRQATHYKGRNRDTAWYSILDKEWPAIRKGLETWLALDNFDAAGLQRKRLRDVMPTLDDANTL